LRQDDILEVETLLPATVPTSAVELLEPDTSDDGSSANPPARVPVPPYIDLEQHLTPLGTIIVANGSDELKAAWQTVMEGTLRMCAAARKNARQTTMFEHFTSAAPAAAAAAAADTDGT
jgi:hypothetical protein